MNLTMSEIKHKDRILEAIDQLRRRKARPDADRICNFLFRRFSVSSKDTIADLERMVQAKIVICVEYKGNMSYRNAAKWSRLAVYRHKEMNDNNHIIEVHSMLSRAFASLLVENPDYLDFGVPENELKKSMLEEDPCLDWNDLDTILLREIHSGYLVRLKNNNYSLADHPVPTSPTNGNLENANDVQMIKLESSSSSSHCDDDTSNIGVNEETDSVIISTSQATDVNKEEIIKLVGAGESHDNETVNSAPNSAINLTGFRVGVRRKRAKKVFDPSDNNVPTRKRGRPLGSTNKNKELAAFVPKVEPVPVGFVCTICHHQMNSRRGQYEKFVACTNCTNKAHPSCLDVGEKLLSYWQCRQCKICSHCMQSGEFEQLVICWGCGEGWHANCHYPEIDRVNGPKWFCFRCVPSKPKSAINGTTMSPSRVSPLNYPASASVTSCESDDQIDECIPDASEWSVEDVSRYLESQGFPDEAAIFKVNEIDGASLLLMKRSDVLLGLQLKLGPALKLYGQVKRLQIRQSDPQLIWA